MIKFVPIVIILLLILIAVPLGSIAINTGQALETERLQNQAERLEKDMAITDLASRLELSKSELEKANKDLDAAQTALNAKSDTIVSLQNNLTRSQQDLSDNAVALKAALAERDTTLERYQTATAQAETYKKTFICQNITPPKFDYTSNQTISDNLKTVVSSLQTPIKKGEWQSIWDNSNITLHNIIGNYKWVFIVTFKDANLGLKPSVFWVDKNCFLDWTM